MWNLDSVAGVSYILVRKVSGVPGPESRCPIDAANLPFLEMNNA